MDRKNFVCIKWFVSVLNWKQRLGGECFIAEVYNSVVSFE